MQTPTKQHRISRNFPPCAISSHNKHYTRIKLFFITQFLRLTIKTRPTMNKTKLQELCHKFRWAAPEYTHCQVGPPHQARYSAFVFVNGSGFDSPDAESGSSKEAHNKAAGVALESLLAMVSQTETPKGMSVAQSVDGKVAKIEDGVNTKSQLQIYAQKRYKEIPKYTTIREEVPKSTPLFKSVVTIDGQSFESPKFFNSLKLAEQAAAELALEFLSKKEENGTPQPIEIPLDDSTNYKSLLQEIMQKERKLLPVYMTVNDPNTLIPTFSSSVEIEGMSFKGESAKSKKQAESNAAKVAFLHLKDRKASQVSLRPCLSNGKINGVNPKMNNGHVSPNSPIMDLNNNQTLNGNYKYVPVESTKPLINPPKPEQIKTTQIHKTNSASNGSSMTWSIVDQSVSSDNGPVSDERKEKEKGGGVEPSFLSHRVQIFPRKPDMVLPPGVTLLPCSDDMWVAVELDYHNQEGANGACMYASMGSN